MGFSIMLLSVTLSKTVSIICEAAEKYKSPG